MIRKNVRNKLASLLVVFIAMSMTCITAFAEECPVRIPAPGEATVSDTVDSTGYRDPNIGTDFWMFIAPDPESPSIKDYPQMGDEGISSQLLMIGAIASGILYLGLSGYSGSNVKRNKVSNV